MTTTGGLWGDDKSGRKLTKLKAVEFSAPTSHDRPCWSRMAMILIGKDLHPRLGLNRYMMNE
jgi:hypothetical protein